MKKFIFAAAAALSLIGTNALATEPCPIELSDAIIDIVDENEIPINDTQDDQDEGENDGKVCFCHNITHNPVTICTAQAALINAHMKHVNGEVPGVADSLGECPGETPIIDCDVEEIPADSPCLPDDGEEPTDDGDEPADDGAQDTFEFADQIADNNNPTGIPFDPLVFEGSGCQLNPMAGSGSAGLWLALALLPALNALRRSRR